MNIIKFLTKAFLAGIVFSMGAYFALVFIIPKSGIVDDTSYYQFYVNEVEESIGKPCLRVHADALEFIDNDVARIIEHGLTGDDWVAIISPEQKLFIDSNDDWLGECDLARNAISQLGEEWPEFSDMHRLFSALRTFTTTYDSTAASATRLKPEAFDMVQEYYRNVAMKSI